VIGWDELVSLARELPEFEESTSYGRPALKVRDKFFAAPDDVREFLFDSWLLAAPKRLAAQFQPE